MLGFFNKIKVSLENYLEHLSSANKKEFGDTIPDCCKLNRTQNPKGGK